MWLHNQKHKQGGRARRRDARDGGADALRPNAADTRTAHLQGAGKAPHARALQEAAPRDGLQQRQAGWHRTLTQFIIIDTWLTRTRTKGCARQRLQPHNTQILIAFAVEICKINRFECLLLQRPAFPPECLLVLLDKVRNISLWLDDVERLEGRRQRHGLVDDVQRLQQ